MVSATFKSSRGTRGVAVILTVLFALAFAPYIVQLSAGAGAGARAAARPPPPAPPPPGPALPDTWPNFTVGGRAAAVVKMETVIDAHKANLGPCRGGEPQLPGLPPGVCSEQPCLWADALRRNVDTFSKALQTLDGPAQAANGSLLKGGCPLPAGGQLPLAEGQSPQVSFVFIASDSSLTVARGLLEVFLTAREAESAEFIVVGLAGTTEQGWAQQVARRLKQLFGVRVVFLEAQSAGDARALGAEAAQGEFLAFVDSHVFVMKGWLATLLRTFRQHPKAAAVSPIVIGPDRTARDVGGLLYSNGTAELLARGQKLIPAVFYMRDADFLTPHAVVFRRAAFQQLWGFDMQFASERYRAADLGMSARAAGLRLLVQPVSLVLHPAKAASMDPYSPGLENLEHDRRRMLYKWGNMLQERHCPESTDALAAAVRHRSPRLLWIGEHPPEPDRDAASARVSTLLRMLISEGYHVTFLSGDAPRHPRYAAALRADGAMLTRKPGHHAWELQEEQRPGGAPGECAYDAVIVSGGELRRAGAGQLGTQCPGVPVVYDPGALGFLRRAREAAALQMVEQVLAESSSGGSSGGSGGGWWGRRPSEGSMLSSGSAPFWAATSNSSAAAVTSWLMQPTTEEGWAAHASYIEEFQLIDISQLILAGSADEAEVIRERRPVARVSVVPRALELGEQGLPPRRGCADRSALLFAGSLDKEPNRQALETLLRDVLPALLELLPRRERVSLQLHVAATPSGASNRTTALVPFELQGLLSQHAQHVMFQGGLSEGELLELYNSTRVVVAPMVSGAGVNGKVTQALALGAPLVTTPVATEGGIVSDGDGEYALVASDPLDFAARVVKAYTDCELWGALAAGGYRAARAFYSAEVASRALLQGLSSIGVGPVHPVQRDLCLPLPAKLKLSGLKLKHRAA